MIHQQYPETPYQLNQNDGTAHAAPQAAASEPGTAVLASASRRTDTAKIHSAMSRTDTPEPAGSLPRAELGEPPPAVRAFLRFLAVSRDCSEKTIQEYTRDLRTFFQFLEACRDGAGAETGDWRNTANEVTGGTIISDEITPDCTAPDAIIPDETEPDGTTFRNGISPTETTVSGGMAGKPLAYREQTAHRIPTDQRTADSGQTAVECQILDGPRAWPPGIDDALLRSVTPADLNRYIAWLRTEKAVFTGRADTLSPGLAPSTTRRRAACLRSFFRYLTETAAVLDRDPSAGLVVPKRNLSLPFFFTEEECRTLLEAVDGLNRERDYALVLLALVSGLRVSEIVSLNVHDIRASQGLFFFRVTGKGGKERQVFLSPNCVEALDRYLAIREATYRPDLADRRRPSDKRRPSGSQHMADSLHQMDRRRPPDSLPIADGQRPTEDQQSADGRRTIDGTRQLEDTNPTASRRPADGPRSSDRDALFLSRKHRRISVDAVQSLVKRAARRAGLTPVSPHKLRHTAASLMLGHGVDIRTISEVLGHSSISSTQIYTHLQSAQLIEACRANPVSRVENPHSVPETERRTERNRRQHGQEEQQPTQINRRIDETESKSKT